MRNPSLIVEPGRWWQTTTVTSGRIVKVPVAAEPGDRYEYVRGDDGQVTLVPVPRPGPARRLVDRDGVGWLLVPGTENDLDPCYTARWLSPARSLSEPWPQSAIVVGRGPVRPVGAAVPADLDMLQAVLSGVRERAAGTLLAALHILYDQAKAGDKHPGRLTAANPGSWEGDALVYAVRECVVAEPVDQEAAGVIFTIAHRWVYGTEPAVDVADAVATVFGELLDNAGGWEQVTTSWLRSSEIGRRARKVLCHKSRHHHGEPGQGWQ